MINAYSEYESSLKISIVDWKVCILLIKYVNQFQTIDLSRGFHIMDFKQSMLLYNFLRTRINAMVAESENFAKNEEIMQRRLLRVVRWWVPSTIRIRD